MIAMAEIDPRFGAAQSTAQILGKIQSTVVNENATLTAVIHSYRDLYFIVDFFPNGDLMAIHELTGADIHRHPDSSMLNAMVKEQIRYNSAKEAVVDTFSAHIPLTVLEGTDTGGCCSVDGDCCGGAPAQADSSDDDEDDHPNALGIVLLSGGVFQVTGLGMDDGDNDEGLVTIEAEVGQSYRITVKPPRGIVLDLDLEWDGEDTFSILGPEGISYFEITDENICMAGTLTANGLLWAPISRAWIEE